MKTIAVLGNSHGACLRQAINEGLFKPEDHGLRVKFFLSPSLSIRDYKPDGHRLVAGSEELRRKMTKVGCPETNVSEPDFDAFLVMGLQFAIEFLDTRVSSSVSKAATENQLKQSVSWRTIAFKLRKITSKPIFAGHQALPARNMDEFKALYPRSETYERALERYSDLYSQKSVTTVRQPAETIEHDSITRAELAAGSKMLLKDTAHDDDDIYHMNADYGAIYWRHFVANA